VAFTTICQFRARLIRFHHGDYIKFNGGVGGISIPVENKSIELEWCSRAALDVFGHFHQIVMWRRGSVMGARWIQRLRRQLKAGVVSAWIAVAGCGYPTHAIDGGIVHSSKNMGVNLIRQVNNDLACQ
jgi:hypothetical protein